MRIALVREMLKMQVNRISNYQPAFGFNSSDLYASLPHSVQRGIRETLTNEAGGLPCNWQSFGQWKPIQPKEHRSINTTDMVSKTSSNKK